MAMLSGIRVVDFTHMIAGPLSTLVLADLGADVIKVEPPEGETARHLGDRYWGEQTDYFVSFNRNKRSVVADLKSPEGKALVNDLISIADVVVENFRGGTAEKLGLGFEDLSKINPRLIYCSISGFGPGGTNASRPAVDPIVQALSGIMQLTGTEESGPLKTGFPLGDYVTPLFGALGILAALFERERTNKGQRVDVSMLDAMVFSMVPREGAFFSRGLSPVLRGNAHSQMVPANTYMTADGREIYVFCHSEKFWRALLEVLDDIALTQDPRFATNGSRLQHREIVDSRIAAAFRAQPLQYWLPRIEAAGASAAPVRTFQEVFDDKEIREKMVAQINSETGIPLSMLRTPIMFNGERPAITRAPPKLGQHTTEVTDEIQRIKSGDARRSLTAE